MHEIGQTNLLDHRNLTIMMLIKIRFANRFMQMYNRHLDVYELKVVVY